MRRPSDEKIAMIQHNAIMARKIMRVLDALAQRADIEQSTLTISRRYFADAFLALDTAIISK